MEWAIAQQNTSEWKNNDLTMKVDRLEFPLAKAEYLFSHATTPGAGGDKQKFWRNILGFQDPVALRAAILTQVTLEALEPKEANDYGQRYQATVVIEGPSGTTWRVKTGWIVLTGETVARFVTAVPERFGRQS